MAHSNASTFSNSEKKGGQSFVKGNSLIRSAGVNVRSGCIDLSRRFFAALALRKKESLPSKNKYYNLPPPYFPLVSNLFFWAAVFAFVQPIGSPEILSCHLAPRYTHYTVCLFDTNSPGNIYIYGGGDRNHALYWCISQPPSTSTHLPLWTSMDGGWTRRNVIGCWPPLADDL